jgi:hypothetical protein
MEHLIDGHHRLIKAQEQGIIHLPAYKLKLHQHIPFLISTEGYLAYVDYWKEKSKY